MSASLHSGTRNAHSLRALPAKYQMNDQARVVLLTEQHDWLRMVIDGQNIEPMELWEARYASGLSCDQQVLQDDVLYRDAWKLRKWGAVGFPKSFSSVDSAFFSLLSLDRDESTRRSTEKTARVFGKLFAKKLSLNDVVDVKSSCELVHLMEFESDRFGQLPIEQPEYRRTSHFLASFRVIGSVDRPDSCQDKAQAVIVGSEMVFRLVTSLVEEQQYRPALKILSDWRSISESCKVEAMRSRCILEQSSVLIKTGDVLQAEGQLNSLLLASDSQETYVLALCQLSELNLTQGNGNDAFQYVVKAREQCIRDGTISREGRSTVHRLLYKLAANQLSDVEASCESRGFRMKKEAINDWNRQLVELRKSNSDPAIRRRIEKELRCEEEDVKKTEDSVRTGAETALNAGLLALEYAGDDASQILFPVIDILFRYGESAEEQEDTNRNDMIIEILMKHIRMLDCSKWVAAARHICGHSFKKTKLGMAIRKIMIRLLEAYPFHTVHTVLFYDDGEKKSPIVMEMLRSAYGSSSELKQIMKDMRNGHRVYKEFGRMDLLKSSDFKKVSSNGRTVYEMSIKCELVNRMPDLLSGLPLPVVEHKIGVPRDYSRDHLVKWSRIDPNCERADGLSTPTVLTVYGSDGKKYKTIWKKEDVRQDCLVEQIFAVVNTLIGDRSEPHPLRTYKVVPLDERTGIIEWCSGTKSLKEILCGDNREGGLHRQVHPDDITAKDAIVAMSKCKPEDKMRVFDQISKQFRPVFRYFFYQHYVTACQYSRMIAEYTKSLARWSIVCYIIGLGDRHTSNVLFEPATAKFVHIDLGMILEYSRRSLPIPELVPFRMTRDIVDPILCDGLRGKVEGIATETVRTLREHREVILGLASVFVRETVSSFKEASEGRSYMSETAISRLRDKLSGLDMTVIEQTPNAQVRRLIKEATDKDNLARIFHGWMPFM